MDFGDFLKNASSPQLNKKGTSSSLFGKDFASGMMKKVKDMSNKSDNSSTKESESLPPAKVHTEAEIAALVAEFSIHGGSFHTDLIYTRQYSSIIAAQEEGKLKVTWYRCGEKGSFDEIAGVTGGFYQPSADDIGSRICARITSTTDESMQSFAQIAVLECLPLVKQRFDSCITAKKKTFHINRKDDPLSEYNLVVTADKCSFERLLSSGSFETVLTIPLASTIQIILDPINIYQLSIQNESVEEIITVESNITRDVLALLLRKFTHGTDISTIVSKGDSTPAKVPTEVESILCDVRIGQVSSVMNALKSQVRNMKIELNLAIKEQAQLRESASAASSKNNQSRIETSEADKEKINALERQNTSLQEQITTLRDTMEAESSMMQTKNEAFRMLQQQLAESGSIQASLQDKVRSLQSQYEKDTAKLSKEHEVALAKRAMDIRNEMEKNHEENSSSSKAKEELLSKEVVEGKILIDKLQVEISQKAKECRNFEMKLEGAMKSIAEGSVFEERASKYKEKFEQSEKLCQRLQADLKEAIVAKESAKIETAKAVAAINDAKITEKEKEISDLQIENESLKEKVLELEKTSNLYAELKDNFDKLEIANKSLKEECGINTNEINKLLEEVALLKAKNEDNLKLQEDLTAQRNAYKSRADSLARNLKKHVAVTSAPNVEIENLKAENSVLKNALDNKATTPTPFSPTPKDMLMSPSGGKSDFSFSSVVGSFSSLSSANNDVRAQQNAELQVLANKLSDIITDKDLAIVQHKTTAKALVQRIKELEIIIETLTTSTGEITPSNSVTEGV